MVQNIGQQFSTRFGETFPTRPAMAERNLPPLFAGRGARRKDFFMPSSIPTELTSMVESLRQVTSGSRADNILDEAVLRIPGMKELRLTYYTYGDFQIISGLQNSTEPYANNLKKLAALGIGSAPQLVLNQHYGDGTSVIMTRIPGAEVEKLGAYNDLSDKVTPEAKEAFLKDMTTLLDAGAVNPLALKGPGQWQVNPENGQIIIPDWSRVDAVANEAERDQMQATIRDHLGL